MKTVRIGVYDEEREYIEMLTTFLKRYGNGKWTMLGYTDLEKLVRNVEKNRLDILISTDYDVLRSVCSLSNEMELLFLSPVENLQIEGMEMDMIYRFQNAKEIGMEITRLILKQQREINTDKYFVAFYSPIGRCGKTKLAYKITENEALGRWLYLNMEDYSSLETFTDTGDILYFIKEKRESKLLSIIEECNGKLVVSQGAFELRSLDKEDMLWLKGVLRKSSYNGFLFDLGTGSIKDFEVFLLYDYVFVPYLTGETDNIKRENFEKILQLYDMEEMGDKLIYLNMDNMEEVLERIEKLLSLGGI